MLKASRYSEDMETLTGKICLVTGATRGIGRAIAKTLLERGALVGVCGRTPDAVDEAVDALARETGGKVAGKAADVRDHVQVAELFQFVDARFGGLDVLVNNAGVGIFHPISGLSIQDWQDTIETNLSGVFYCTKEAVARFGARGGGHIVNISSLAGKNPFAGGGRL